MQAEQLDGSRSNLNLHCLLGEERTYPLDVVEHGSAGCHSNVASKGRPGSLQSVPQTPQISILMEGL